MAVVRCLNAFFATGVFVCDISSRTVSILYAAGILTAISVGMTGLGIPSKDAQPALDTAAVTIAKTLLPLPIAPSRSLRFGEGIKARAIGRCDNCHTVATA